VKHEAARLRRFPRRPVPRPCLAQLGPSTERQMPIRRTFRPASSSRVAIARPRPSAMHPRAKFLCDEPTLALDPELVGDRGFFRGCASFLLTNRHDKWFLVPMNGILPAKTSPSCSCSSMAASPIGGAGAVEIRTQTSPQASRTQDFPFAAGCYPLCNAQPAGSFFAMTPTPPCLAAEPLTPTLPFSRRSPPRPSDTRPDVSVAIIGVWLCRAFRTARPLASRAPDTIVLEAPVKPGWGGGQ